MGGSPKPPKQSDSQRHAEEEQAKLLEEQRKQAENPVQIPKIPKPLPPPPPPTSSSADVAMAAEDARRKAAKRTNSAKGTLFGGETGGYNPNALGGAKTLLG